MPDTAPTPDQLVLQVRYLTLFGKRLILLDPWIVCGSRAPSSDRGALETLEEIRDADPKARVTVRAWRDVEGVLRDQVEEGYSIQGLIDVVRREAVAR